MPEPPSAKPFRGRRPSLDVVRAVVFVLAMVTVIYAGSGPRPW
ncbi:hypothetical protein [Streptomyces sp. CC53]|nr:hypothetical protein [Streptomyces sp. CC53]